MATDSVQDYLKVIYSLEEAGDKASTTAIASRVGVSPASATSMMKRLAGEGLVRHRRYRGVELTPHGRTLALEVVRHHRLIEQYLHESLGMEWDKVHDEAEVLEHVLSEELEDIIAERLGHPTHDPHGDPIPPKKGRHTQVHHDALGEAGVGPAKVERVSDRDPSVLRYLARVGIRPGTTITIEEQDAGSELIWVKVGRKRHPIALALASGIYVSRNA